MERIFREATAPDWPAIKLLLGDSTLPIAGAREHLSQFMVCEAGGEVVGCAGAEVYGAAALLRSLAVAESVQSRGVGTKLVDLLIARLKARGVREVGLLTTTAEAYFARRGFVVAQRANLPAAVAVSEELKGACPNSAVAMTRSI